MVRSSPTLFALTAFLSLPTLTLAADVIYELPVAHATVYYDLTNKLCGNQAGDPFKANWAEVTGINNGIPFCQGQTAKTLKEIGTNRVVAMNGNMVTGNPAEWCGKEVQIIQADGTPLVFDEGPLFIWDACAACSGTPIIDVSAKVFTQLKGGTCAGNNPDGLKVQVLNNNVWAAGPGEHGGASGGSVVGPTISPSPKPSPSPPPVPAPVPSRSTSSAAIRPIVSSQSRVVPVPTGLGAQKGSVDDLDLSVGQKEVVQVDPVPSSSAVIPLPTLPARSSSRARQTSSRTSSATSSAASTGQTTVNSACEFGEWRCVGLVLQVCNRVDLEFLGWETIDSCPAVCEITPSGSVDCQ